MIGIGVSIRGGQKPPSENLSNGGPFLPPALPDVSVLATQTDDILTTQDNKPLSLE